MEIEEKNKRIIEMSDSDFLAFLYAERDREESLSKYQGWNIWAVAGALVTVLCAGYTVISQNVDTLDRLSIAYYVSGLIALFLCLRPFSLINTRARGVDYNRVKFLKDTASKQYLCLALISSVFFSFLFPFINEVHPWGIVTILWIIMALLFVFTTGFVLKNRNSVVRSDLDGRLFVSEKWESRFAGVIGGVLSVLVVQSFRTAKGPLIGSPDFEVAVCVSTAVALVYILTKIRKGVKASEHLDILIDDFLYKGKTKESVFQELLFHRMGYSVFGACSKELSELRESLDSLETQQKRVDEISILFNEGSFDINRMSEYINEMLNAINYSKRLNDRINALGDRLTQITKVDADIEKTMAFIKMQKMQIILLKQANEMMKSISDAGEKMVTWIQVYHCKKYGGWCVQECGDRLDNPSLRYRFEMFCLHHFQNLSSIVKMRKPCKETTRESRES